MSTISEKLQIIAENQQRVYDAGYAAGQAAGGGGDTEAAYQQGVVDGKQVEYDRFWDAYQEKGTRGNYSYAFSRWNDETFEPKYDLTVTNANGMFHSSTITGHEKILSADFSKCTNFGLAFISSAIEEFGVIDFASCNALTQVFQSAKVKKIAKLIVYESTVINDSVFRGAENLTDVTFEGVYTKNLFLQWSPLNKVSIQSAMSVLSDTVTDKTVTFSKAAVDAAFETSEGAADGSTSEEWLALVATKPNWTITLV